MSTDQRDVFRAGIASALEVRPDQVMLFAKGRVALYAILRALDIAPGDEVILPAFTCVAVPNAIIYAGGRPVYVDIDPVTYTIDPAAVEAAVSPRTRVVLAQNTFGLSADLDGLSAVAARHGLAVVDDCTHGLGGRYHDRPNGSSVGLSFFSTQWSKPLSTGLGGFAVAIDDAMATRLRRLEAAAPEPRPIRSAILRGLVFGAERAGRGRLFRTGRSAYRTLSRIGIVPGSSNREELEGIAMPEGFLAGLSPWQARMGATGIQRLGTATDRRRSIAARYTDWLTAHGRTSVAEPAGTTHAFLRYPLRVDDRDAFVAAAEHAGVDLGDWFVSPLHPVVAHLDRWGYRAGSAPLAEAACAEIVNLPTDPGLSEREIERVLEFLSSRVDLIR